MYSTSANAYLLLLMHIYNGLVHIRNGFFMTLSLTLNTELSPWELPLRIIVLSASPCVMLGMTLENRSQTHSQASKLTLGVFRPLAFTANNSIFQFDLLEYQIFSSTVTKQTSVHCYKHYFISFLEKG